ncbi:uncharacterized protein LOC122649680 [Telopea speciosissima]|uniref:uncharacterized protein LOC122649680 n=1 Tax=Telopea speciosissima TaxID=54955 RepID=UPI001CC719A5|nr:uncharacterized protein LOC122649680 [Telopea speciosissima]
MRLSQSTSGSPSEGRKQRKPSSLPLTGRGSERDHLRARKKHKKLDAICENYFTRNRNILEEPNESNAEGTSEAADSELRRSSRVRRAPVLLDSSPPPVKKRSRVDQGGVSASNKKKEKFVGDNRENDGSEKPSPRPNSGDLEEPEGWKSRLRSRAKRVSFVLKAEQASPSGKRRLFDESDGLREETNLADTDSNTKKDVPEGAKSHDAKLKRHGKARGPMRLKNDNLTTAYSNRKEEDHERDAEKILLDLDGKSVLPMQSTVGGGSERAVVYDSFTQVIGKDETKTTTVLPAEEDASGNKDLEAGGKKVLETASESDKQMEQTECKNEIGNAMDAAEILGPPINQSDNEGCRAVKDTFPGKFPGRTLENENVEKENKAKNFSTNALVKPRIHEGRRCGLCGGGADGKPPKRLVRDSVESDNEGGGGSSASEEPNYDIWDGFGDEPGWLGRLLGPMNDRFGIAGVWVHQHCAVWSPEVYFAGLGCLKNVRAALCRGRALKCSRCGRSGATIGCRVDRCPKTYHLPCGRADGCVFDHKKFLIACSDHRYLFQPHGNEYLHRQKRMKARKMKLETRKLSHDAWRKDFEAEEKWLENCGEDEEFLKRERKRLHRDLLRIAPVYIGGSSSESEKLYQGWESVAGLQDVVQCLKEVVILPLLYPEFFNNMGITPPRGVLLHGYPGTGKTLVVRALIGSCARGDKRIAYFARKGADCLGKYVGDAERQLRLLFQVAEKSQPSIIFFDEIDGLAPCRTRQQDQTHSSVVSTLLALLDGLKSRGSVIVIGATNRPEAVDPALRRPGRFDREIYFPLPSVEDRASILSLHTQRWPKPASGSLLQWIAKQTAGFAGADLQALCTQAAMIALKRNCALQELLSAAEKKDNIGKCVPLPSFSVEERDWLDALACSPPPCSRREAGMAANDIVASPLHAHLTPCLLRPLLHLIVSLSLDERLWLPPSLSKAAKLIKNVAILALEKKKMPGIFWSSCLLDLMKEADVVREIERNLSYVGLLVGASSFADFNALNDDTDDGHGNVDTGRSNSASARINLFRNVSSSSRTSGFRVLIAGSPRSGQKHLASCLLHAYVGNVEIQKVNLATIAQGQGDFVEAVTHILLKCASMRSCVIFMPRIDLWSIETQHQFVEEDLSSKMSGTNVKGRYEDARDDSSPENASFSKTSGADMTEVAKKCALQKEDSSSNMSESDKTPRLEVRRENVSQENGSSLSICESDATVGPKDYGTNVSQAWNSFVELVESMCLSASFMILATSEVPSQVLPLGIKQFFSSDILNSNSSAHSVHTIPRFLVQVDGKFNHDEVISSSAAELSADIVKQYVQLIHQRTHCDSVWKEYKICVANEGSRQMEGDIAKNVAVNERGSQQEKSETIVCSGNASSGGLETQPYIHDSEGYPPISRQNGQDVVGQHRPQDIVPRNPPNNRILKGKSSLLFAISSFGFQILRYPHFAELCWATSKLKEGPCTDINGPWKGWSFNSCIVRPNNSLEKVAVGLSSSNIKSKENSGLVRGLIAVGLLAYEGFYSSVREVSFDVRKVLDLLVGEINARIQAGKDRYQFLRLLSQVAYLEDMVNSWAYMLKSLELDSQMPVSDPRPTPDNSHTCVDSLIECDAHKKNVSVKYSYEANQEESPQQLAIEKIGYIGSNKGVPNLGLPESEVGVTTSNEGPQQTSTVLQSSSSAADPVATVTTVMESHECCHSEQRNSENPVSTREVCGDFGCVKKSNGSATERSVNCGDIECCPAELGDLTVSRSSTVCNQSNGLSGAETYLLSEADPCNHEELTGDDNSNINSRRNLSAASGITCLYECCDECLHNVYGLIQEILNHECDSNESCSVEDLHDIVSSWSMNLLSAIRKLVLAESNSGSEKGFNRKLRPGDHGISDPGIFKFKKPSCQCISSGNKLVMPVECSCHSRCESLVAKTNAYTNSQFRLDLKFIIRDNVLVPANPDEAVSFHHKFRHLCLCSLIEWILMIKQPLS